MEEKLPVIIGNGLTGMIISRSLSSQQIRHILIGMPPGSNPRLGESIDPSGTFDLLRLYPSYSKYFLEKKFLLTFFGNFVFLCDFNIRSRASKIFFRIFGYKPFSELIHIDRINFDRHFYDDTIKEPSCNLIIAKVESISYDKKNDKIQSIKLNSGRNIEPKVVFDATNHIRLVSRAIGVKIHYISTPQLVIFAHYYQSENSREIGKTRKWLHTTNLMRLDKKFDEIQGIAWCIPLGNYVSVGVSIRDTKPKFTKSEIMKILEQAYSRRGLKFFEVYPVRKEIISLKQRYFIHQKAFGTNWLLAGPSYCQVWFMSASGVGTSLLTAQIAAKFISNRSKYGKIYQNQMNSLLETHRVYNRTFVDLPIDGIDKPKLRSSIQLVALENVKRIGNYFHLRKGILSFIILSVYHYLIQINLIKTEFCFVCAARLETQTEEIFKVDLRDKKL